VITPCHMLGRRFYFRYKVLAGDYSMSHARKEILT